MQTVEQVREALENGQRVTSLANLVRVAIEDGRAMLAVDDIKIVPNFSNWCRASHYVTEFGELDTDPPRATTRHCTACLAGAVMLGTLSELKALRRVLPQLGIGEWTDLDDSFHGPAGGAMWALDYVRKAQIENAYRALSSWDNAEHGALDEAMRGYKASAANFVGREKFEAHLNGLERDLLTRLDAFEEGRRG